MTDNFDDIKPEGLEEIPNRHTPTPESMKPVDEIKKPEADVKLDLKDAAPILKSELEETMIDVLKGGWTYGKTIGFILTLISFVALLFLNRC